MEPTHTAIVVSLLPVVFTITTLLLISISHHFSCRAVLYDITLPDLYRVVIALRDHIDQMRSDSRETRLQLIPLACYCYCVCVVPSFEALQVTEQIKRLSDYWKQSRLNKQRLPGLVIVFDLLVRRATAIVEPIEQPSHTHLFLNLCYANQYKGLE